MVETRADLARQEKGTRLKRRGLLAAAWAAAAAFVTKQTTEPVTATTTDTDFVATGTGIVNFDARGSGTTGIETANGTFDTGVDAFGSAYGLYAIGGSYGASGIGHAAGVLGTVLGVSAGGTSGVWGTNFAAGAGSIGVRGTIPAASAAANTIAVSGENLSTNGAAPGAGVYGFSAHGHGVLGASTGPGNGAIVGSAFGVPGVWAGLFFGPMAVVSGPKSAAVANGDGTHTLLYCMESPESWFEDFGEATLECGRAIVRIDPAFAAVADMTNYHVFVTARGDFQLYVAAQDPDRFTVEQTTGTGVAARDGTFSWRLVAKRKDIKAERLAKVHLPSEPTCPSPPAESSAMPTSHVSKAQ